MNRIPPNLLYLTIYNPTLQPSGPVEDDDEDAEEQAHILFYTSKERAVSRDRMLRQIGLAKALINYAELFNSDSPCDNVHSQARRMIMVSPEPCFWIHAGVEVAKVPRIIDPKFKPKLKGKTMDKGKEKEKEQDALPLYDYKDGSVHDGTLRAHILKGYERFKLTHGSFTTILSTLGQQALELQLERFWTVWAWSWDLEQPPDFGEEFGPLLHPSFSSLIPLIDEFSANLSTSAPVVLTRSCIIPSGRYTECRFPSALSSHLSSMFPPKLHVSHSSDTLNTLASSVDTIRGRHPSRNAKVSSSNPQHDGAINFLGMPTINMKMDIPKWNWPGYLTFGKGGASKPTPDKSTNLPTPKEKQDPQDSTLAEADQQKLTHVEVEVNAKDLEDAISSDSMSTTSEDKNGGMVIEDKDSVDDDSSNSDHSTDNEGPLDTTHSIPSSLSDIFLEESETTSPPSPPPLPEFSMTKVHLTLSQDPSVTARVSINYMIKNDFMLALIGGTIENEAICDDDEVSDLQTAAEKSTTFFESLESKIHDVEVTSLSDSLPSATRILQPQDRYLISTGQYTDGTPGFASVSSHLFNAKAILDRDPEITEVFSRGQNPQHWHIAKRGLGGSTIDSEIVGTEEAVFMEVFRKEASLTDVDNVLVGVVKKSGLADGLMPKSR